jgi:MoxR-like ATPase
VNTGDASARQAENVPVLLIDEIDRADDQFEGFLLELLSEFQVTIPELGTIRARKPPIVVITSNRTRNCTALKRRCLYHWIVSLLRERASDRAHAHASGAEASGRAGDRLRAATAWGGSPSGRRDLETLDWVAALMTLGQERLDLPVVEQTLGIRQGQRGYRVVARRTTGRDR